MILIYVHLMLLLVSETEPYWNNQVSTVTRYRSWFSVNRTWARVRTRTLEGEEVKHPDRALLKWRTGCDDHCCTMRYIYILFPSPAVCNCNDQSTKCFFDRHLYNLTGHGGHCMDCQRNRDGPNCERCKENFVMRSDGYCINCDCDPVGE